MVLLQDSIGSLSKTRLQRAKVEAGCGLCSPRASPNLTSRRAALLTLLVKNVFGLHPVLESGLHDLFLSPFARCGLIQKPAGMIFEGKLCGNS